MSGQEKGMTVIVKTVTRLTLGFILLYGVYVGLSGHISPGGGFAGGVIIALSFVHVMLAFGKDVALKRLHSYLLRTLAAVSGLVFLCMVMINFSGQRLPLRIIIPLSEMVIVGLGLFAIFIALVLLSKQDRDSE